MLTIEQTREMLADFNLPEKEMEDIRVLSWLLAGVAFDVWQESQINHDDKSPTDDVASGN